MRRAILVRFGVFVIALWAAGCSGSALEFQSTGGTGGVAGSFSDEAGNGGTPASGGSMAGPLGGSIGVSGAAVGGQGGSDGGVAGGGVAGGAGGTLSGGGGVAGSGVAGSGADGGGADAALGWIAFDSDTRTLDRNIYVMRADGSARALLVGDPSNDSQPTFSPDGRLLAFVSDREGMKAQIYVLDLETRVLRRLTDREGGASRPAFSSDSQRVGFRSGMALVEIGVDGSDERLIPSSSPCLDDGSCTFGAPTYTADGNWVVYDGYNRVDATRLDGSEQRTIVPPTTAEQSSPSVSQSGFSVALQVTCGDGNLSIWVVPFSGISGFTCNLGRRVSRDGEHAAHAAFGPSDALLWDSGHASGDLVLWRAGTIIELTKDGADDRNPAWVPKAALPLLFPDDLTK